MKRGSLSLSGERYRKSIAPRLALFRIRSIFFLSPVRDAARAPKSLSWLVWSSMRAMRGEITMHSPPRTSAGSWKHKDFPPPVGKRAITSVPEVRADTGATWNFLSSSKPQIFLRVELMVDFESV